MPTTTLGIKADEALRARLRAAAERTGRTPHWLIKQAIQLYLARIEAGETLDMIGPVPTPRARAGSAGGTQAAEAADAGDVMAPGGKAGASDGPRPFQALLDGLQPQTLRRAAITAACRLPEPQCVPALIAAARMSPAQQQAARELAARLIGKVRGKRRGGGVEGLLHEFSLSSQEGIALMCLAEALLRIPDRPTRDALIRDKISHGQWAAHLGQSSSLFVNAAAWGLMITGRLVGTSSEAGLSAALSRLIGKGGEPLVRRGVDFAMRLMGEQFVAGETIAQALAHGRRHEDKGFRYSYDMLGEAAIDAQDAERYMASYRTAIHAIGVASNGRGIHEGPGISIKLSALHPRYSRAQYSRVIEELLPRLLSLARLARHHDIGLNIDAEEADRLEVSLDLIEALCRDPSLAGWHGIGVVVQAYQKRASAVIDHLIGLARETGHRLMLRLVKGAYWDSEIKRAQVDGAEGFPVHTRKVHTDVSYLACARRLLAAPDAVFPQFATHNAMTLAAVHAMAGANYYAGQYEFQCLHGMGEPLYEEVVGRGGLNRPCRIYAPVGRHENLLAYLVRRLLENGANTSFVNRVADPHIPIDALCVDPVGEAQAIEPLGQPHPRIALPSSLFGTTRLNSAGLDLNSEQRLASLVPALLAGARRAWQARPMLQADAADRASQGERHTDRHTGRASEGAEGAGRAEGVGAQAQTAASDAGAAGDRGWRAVVNPADRRDRVGEVLDAALADVDAALACSVGFAPVWAATPPAERAQVLQRAALAFEAAMPGLIGLMVREAGKTLPAAVAEVREAVDFLRYYAARVRNEFGNDRHLPLGPVACISPWNFPLAIFTGQVAAALAAGNTVLAKPAEQTSLVAAEAVRLMHESGLPAAALQLLPGAGEVIGVALVADPRVAGVVFTGSTQVARVIRSTLARRFDRHGRPIPLIAETGGQNAMIVDSSALPEQVVSDVMTSAFDSAGQRCSALRVLCLQEDVADRVMTLLRGAMRELSVGNPDRLSTDVGPVIDADARGPIERHIDRMRMAGHEVWQVPLAPSCAHGEFVAPTLITIDSIAQLDSEVFGPVLHVLRYRRDALDELVDAINATGYALTFGVHSRIDETIERVSRRIRAGNVYVNRNLVGAVVGVQPFGGSGLSGTGPKAGGPLYLRRLLADAPRQRPLGLSGRPVPVALAWCAHLNGLGDAQAALHGEACIERSAVGAEVELPGPTGERNTYELRPRGTVLVIASTGGGLRRLIGAALAAGNRALFIATPAAMEGLDPLPAPVAASIEQWEQGGSLAQADVLADDFTLPERPFDAVLYEGDSDGLLRLETLLAQRPGPIIAAQGLLPHRLLQGSDDVVMEWLVHERSISVNTAAAGGNASLMAIG